MTSQAPHALYKGTSDLVARPSAPPDFLGIGLQKSGTQGRRENQPLREQDVDNYVEGYQVKYYQGLLEVEPPVFLSYEQLKGDAPGVMSRLLDFLGADPAEAPELVKGASFEKLSGRRPAEEDPGSYYRKGVVGDWRTKMDPRRGQHVVESMEDLTRQVESRHGLDLSAYRAA